jgi:hypothetical protein
MALSTSTGTFVQYTNKNPTDRSSVERKSNGNVLYSIDLNFSKINEIDHIKWCRKNLGTRSENWDFWLAGNILFIEVWGDKAKFTYEMWKN